MYGCESWTIKKAECQRINAFELWCWRRLLRVPWTARRSNLSILKEINPEYSLEALMLKPKLQYFGHLMWRVNSLEKTRCWERLRAGGEGVNRRWDAWLASPTHEFGQTPGDGEGQGSLVSGAQSSVTQSCSTFCNRVNCSPPGSSVHGIFQARILEQVAISYSRGSSWLRDWTHISCVSCIGWWILYHWATWEACYDE